MSALIRDSDGTKTFSYTGSDEDRSIVLEPARGKGTGGADIYGLRLSPEFVTAIGLFTSGALTDILGIPFDESDLREAAAAFTEAADILAAANEPERAVELGAEGHGIC